MFEDWGIGWIIFWVIFIISLVMYACSKNDKTWSTQKFNSNTVTTKFNGYVVNGKYNNYVLNESTCYVDDKGYLRDKKDDRLVHRTIAYFELYKDSSLTRPFSEYVVHHKDKNKMNDRIDNLEVLPEEIHEYKHSKKLEPKRVVFNDFFVLKIAAGKDGCGTCFQNTNGWCEVMNAPARHGMTCDAWIGKSK